MDGLSGGHRKASEMIIVFYSLAVVVVTWLNVFVKPHQIAHFKLMSIILEKFYFEKANFSINMAKIKKKSLQYIKDQINP